MAHVPYQYHRSAATYLPTSLFFSLFFFFFLGGWLLTCLQNSILMVLLPPHSFKGLLHMSSTGTDTAAAVDPGAGGPANAFVTGPEDLSDPDSPINAPRVFVSMVDESEELHLIIYQAGGQ